MRLQLRNSPFEPPAVECVTIVSMLIPSLALLLVTQAATLPQSPGIPSQPGIYYHKSDLKWLKLEPAEITGGKEHGAGLFIETEGLSGIGRTVVYKGPQARMVISERKPVFYVRGAGQPEDALIVELERKKDSRTINTSSSTATIDNKAGFKRSAVRKVVITRYSDRSFALTPEQELKPGEYIVAFGYADKAFDFEIAK